MISQTAGILVVLAIIVIIIFVARAGVSSDRIEQGECISSTKRTYKKKLIKREKIRQEISSGEAKFVDRAAALSAVESDGLLLEFVGEEYKNDREIVLAAIEETMTQEYDQAMGALLGDPETPLKFASSNLQNDEGVVTTAIEQSYEAFFHASSELRSNLDIIFQALEKECTRSYLCPTVLEAISPLLLRDTSKFYEFLKAFERRDYDEFMIGDDGTVVTLDKQFDLAPKESVPYLNVLSDDIREMLKDETIRKKALKETTWAKRYEISPR